MSPSRIPVAISFERRDASRHCIRCGTCDGYACAAEAKNDLATGLIPRLVRQGMTLRPNSVCVRLHREGERITGVEIVDRITGATEIVEGTRVILAAGTLATPHLLLSSNLAPVNPAGHAVGRYLTRHRNAVIFGVFPTRPNPSREFDKQIAILDHYEVAGSLQQLTPPLGLVRSYLPRGLRSLGAALVEHSSGLIAIAEDQPRRENGVEVDWSQVDRFGLPRLRVDHSYSHRDQHAARVLIVAAKKIMRQAGARFTWVHAVETFSHALGTVRMGVDERSAPLDEQGRYRGTENLYVTDGSALPRSASLNPSLTIAANALRIGSGIVGQSPVRAGRRLRMLDQPMTFYAITQP
jgi:choline dehydrogenase-like flavoprotein